MRINRSTSIDNLAFTAVVTLASWTFILRDRLLGRVKRAPLENHPCLEISRRTIASDKQFLDAVFVTPAREPARAAVLLCHGIGETVDHWLGVQKLLAAQGVASLVFDYTGYGASTGRIRWKQCEEDAIEAFGALEALLPGTSVSILGFSLGSGIAAAVLDYISPQKLILCSSFTSFQAAACCAGLPQGFLFWHHRFGIPKSHCAGAPCLYWFCTARTIVYSQYKWHRSSRRVVRNAQNS